uniref:Protein ZIP4 homolog n=1 Tax=Astatotilapia calliptera TaxID=8154 RepID=A0A3P8QEJ0_ASTCA
MSRGNGTADISSSKEDVEKDLLRILSYQAESAITQGNNKEAVAYIQRCKDMLLRLPKDTAYLSLMCYNFGIDAYNVRKYEDTAFWLSQSYDIGKMNMKYGPGSEVLAKALRLLATVYLEWDCEKFAEKAVNAVSLANKECVSTYGLYLKIKILLRCESSDRLNEMLESEVSLELCLSTVKLLISEKREALAFEYLKSVCQHFETSPDLGTALVLHIELLLQRGKELLGKQKIEDVITGHCTGKQLTTQALTSLHVLLWDKASKYFEAGSYSEALQWYNYSLSLFKGGQMEPNLAKLQRNRASCFLKLKQLEKAKEAIKEAQRCDPDNIFTQFSVYKVAVQENENGQQETAMKALEILCEHSKDQAQVLVALRYKQHFNLTFIKITISHPSHMTVDQRTEEANWFRKIAWNLALQCESSPDKMRDFFVLSYQFSQLCPPDRTLLMGQRTCLLMAAAASLELGRKSSHPTQFTQTLEHIQICSEVWKTLKASGAFSNSLLLLYEFEARAKLNDPIVEAILESVLELESVEPKMLETMAALAMEPPAYFPLLCKKALRVALFLHKKQPQADLAHCSKCVHSLIKLSLPSGVSEVEAHVLKEVWNYYEEALSIIAAPDDFPEMETLWLLTQAWNTGILLYSLAEYPEAEKWCGLAMSFVRHLGSLQESYETQMSGLYSKILDRLDKAKKNVNMKE